MNTFRADRPALAWMDGAVVNACDATVPLADEGVLRGDGVFETLLVHEGKLHALDGHLARLARSADLLEIPLPDVLAPLSALLHAYGPHDGIAKIVLMRGGTLRLIVSPPAPWPETVRLDVQAQPWGGLLSGAKTLSYAVNQFSVRQAQANGCDDALIVWDGTVRELAHGTIVLVEDGQMITPDPARNGILASVTLDVLASVADVTFDVIDVQRLWSADELFVLSATRLAVGVSRLRFSADSVRSVDAPGPVTAAAHDMLIRHVAAHAHHPSPD